MIRILKFNVLVLMMLIITTSLSAQDSDIAQDKSDVTHEVGINASFFIQQFISLGTSTNVNISPYAITYRRIKSNKGIFRAGFGINGNSRQSDDFGVSANSVLFTMNTRIGIERQFNLGNRWAASFGGDLRNSFQYAKTETSQFQGNFSALDETYLTGIGLVLGIRFDINKKIGLYTETVFLTSLGVEKSTTQFNVSDSSKSKQTLFSSAFGLPTSIYFTIKL